MASYIAFILLCIACATFGFPANDIDIITEPKPGQEYVFVQSSALGARPIARKDKATEEERQFETAHKLPPSLTFALNQEEESEEKPLKHSKPHKRSADPGAPAPAGAIKLNVAELLAKYKTELKTSTTERPKSTTKSATRRTTKGARRTTNKRVKKEAKDENAQLVATSPSPVLTTGRAAPKTIDTDDIPLVASGSEKQRSRIQVKKGPNGQEYEYEYVYYYYDDEEDTKDAKSKVSNSHDGPARNQISSRGEKKKATPEANEVLPSTRSKTRSRQLGEEETVNEERLPANTRFPPRSRNLNTTPLPEEEPKSTTSRGRGRGRPTTEAAPVSESDNISDETQGSRGRTRANVRRPSLDLVDSASFNTHSAGAEPHANGPSFPTDLPAGPEEVAEKVKTPEQTKEPAPVSEADEEDATNAPDDATTMMSPMDKVALDLYAILQGTQKLSGEDTEISTEEGATDETEGTTIEVATDPIEVETTTPTTTTTTTTTTTPAPTTTTTTTEAPHGRGRFKGRGGIGRKTTKSHETAASSTESTASESKPKNKYGRPSFGNRRSHQPKTTPEPAAEAEATKEESKPVSHSRPTLSRGRFGASRPRGRTTAAPSSDEENKEESGSSSSSTPATTHSRPSLPRARPSFNLRTRGRSTTAAPNEEEASSSEDSKTETSSTTAKPSRRSGGSAVRPLRPGPRINLATRGRAGASTTTTAAPAVEDHVTGDEEPETEGETEEKEAEAAAAPVDNSPLGRLRNKNRVNVQARPKAAASAPVQVRRVNPLLANRRRPGQTTEATSSEAPQESSATEATNEEVAETDAPASSSSSTTEEPRGLNKLLAGRRRLAARGNH